MNQKQANKLLAQIKPEFRPFFEAHERVSSSKPVLIVGANKFEQFLTILLDSDVDAETKVLVVLMLCGAARVSEVLSLTRASLDRAGDGTIFFSARVLKKRRIVHREFTVHPLASGLVIQHCLTKRGFERLFTMSRFAAIRRVKKAFGIDASAPIGCHDWRHAGISRMLFNKEISFSIQRVAALQELSPRMVMVYAHLNQRETLKELFKVGA